MWCGRESRVFWCLWTPQDKAIRAESTQRLLVCRTAMGLVGLRHEPACSLHLLHVAG